jgi:hypothetical protein
VMPNTIFIGGINCHQGKPLSKVCHLSLANWDIFEHLKEKFLTDCDLSFMFIAFVVSFWFKELLFSL